MSARQLELIAVWGAVAVFLAAFWYGFVLLLGWLL